MHNADAIIMYVFEIYECVVQRSKKDWPVTGYPLAGVVRSNHSTKSASVVG